MNPRYVYATAEECSATSYCQDFVYRSVDRGVTWTRGLTARIHTLEVQAGGLGVVYAIGTKGGKGSEGEEAFQVYRSSDHGKSWKLVTTRTGSSPEALAVNPLDPNLVLATTMGGKEPSGGKLLRSADGGKTWTESATGDIRDLRFSLTGAAVLGVRMVDGAASSILRSVDGGVTWTAVLTAPGDEISDLVANPLDPKEYFASTRLKGIYRSTDEGLTFSPMEMPGRPVPSEGEDHPLSLSRSNPQTLYTTANGVLWAYTFPARAGALPQTGDPFSNLLPTVAALGAALSLIGLRLRRSLLS